MDRWGGAAGDVDFARENVSGARGGASPGCCPAWPRHRGPWRARWTREPGVLVKPCPERRPRPRAWGHTMSRNQGLRGFEAQQARPRRPRVSQPPEATPGSSRRHQHGVGPRELPRGRLSCAGWVDAHGSVQEPVSPAARPLASAQRSTPACLAPAASSGPAESPCHSTEMDKVLLLLLLLGVSPLVLFPAQATLCRVCDVSVKGWCVHGQGNCTVDEGRSCRTRDVYYLDTRDGWVYNHTILDCASPCRAWKLFRSELKVSTYCCRGRDFCNTRRGVTVKKGAH